MLDRHNLHDYQNQMIDFMKDTPRCAVFAGLGLGKEQPKSEPVLTTHGWKPMGEIQVGDYVYSRTGKPTKVVAVFPQGEKDVMKISFKDGTHTFAGRGHLWDVIQHGKGKHKVLTTEEIRLNLASELSSSDTWRNPKGKVRKWSVPLTEPIEYPERDVYIHPYTFAMLLGKPSIEKFLPPDYLYNSLENRWHLLQGLLDTQGREASPGNWEYSTSSPQLAKDVEALARSLGLYVRVTNRTPKNTHKSVKKDGSLSWRVYINFNKTKKTITNVEFDRVEDSQCLMVDCPTHTYLTRDYIVTHNSTTALTVLNDIDDVQNILIVAPLRVANSVWMQESRLWGHLRDLDIVVATGTQKQRIEAINKRARITVTNQENLPWLINNSGVPWRWDMLVYDESTGIKNPSAIRFKALKRITKYLKRVILLTATPLPNGMLDLWSQIYLLDGGERLGRSLNQYRVGYFTRVGFMGYGYQLNAGAKEEILNKISDITLTLDVEDLLEMPDRVDLVEYVEMASSLMKKYKELEQDFLYELAEDNTIEVLHAAALANKLLQFASGCVYDEDGQVHFIHDEKIQRLRELREAHPNENMLVAYNFKFELAALLKAFPDGVLLDKKGEAIVDWNDGKIPMLIANPKSASMGLNLQKGSSILVWFGMSWSLLDYEQFNGRLYRQGQKNKVRIVHILTKGTMDDKVYSAIKAKAKTQSDVLGHLKLYNGEF